MAFVTTSFLEREYALSPVPVLECSPRDWHKVCKSKGLAFGSAYGGYYYDMRLHNAPQGLVVINCNLPNYKRLAVFYHELSHIECSVSNCHCFNEQSQLDGICEHHAQVGALLKCSKVSSGAPLIFSMIYALTLSNSILNSEQHKGARMTVEHPFWEVCKNKLGELYKWVDGHGCSTVEVAV